MTPDQIKLESIIKLQAFIRGYYARIMTRILKNQVKVKKKYFLEDEFWETISKIEIYDS